MTLDPANGDRTRIVIDASWGLGETVVSGTVTPDNFVVEKVLQEILTRTISDKHMEMVADAQAGEAVEREIADDRPICPQAQTLWRCNRGRKPSGARNRKPSPPPVSARACQASPAP